MGYWVVVDGLTMVTFGGCNGTGFFKDRFWFWRLGVSGVV